MPKFILFVTNVLRSNVAIRNYWWSSKGSSTDSLRPFVEHPWAYAYGRSNRALRNRTLNDLLETQVEKDGKRTAIVSVQENLTKSFSELNDDANILAAGLRNKLGISRGDVVGIWSCNAYNWILAEYATAKLGAIVCTINPMYKLPELEYILDSGQVKCLFMPGLKSQQTPANNFFELISSSKLVNSDNNKHLKDIIYIDGEKGNKIGNVNTHKITDVMDSSQSISKEVTDQVSCDDPLFIMYTSGTTGKPKGAVLSHHTIVNNALFAAARQENANSGVICLTLPLFHAFAATIGSITMPCVSNTLGYWFNVKVAVESIVKHNCDILLLTPTMIIDIMKYVYANKIKLNSVKNVIMGGATVPVEVAHKVKYVIPSATDIRVGYGATELGPLTTISELADSVELKMETVGAPLDFVECKIVDPINTKLLKIGEQGELWVRGHNVMAGYWKNEERTKEVITKDGWYKTGDIATMDEAGYIKIVGRTKEMVIRGGEKIYPREVEELLHTHPDVEFAAVCGVPAERTGEELCAWIKLKDPEKEVKEEDIKNFCKDKITYFKVPKHILFVKELTEFPMTTTRKVKKFEMTEKSCEILGIKQQTNKQ